LRVVQPGQQRPSEVVAAPVQLTSLGLAGLGQPDDSDPLIVGVR
jgi:hypothetical protein